MAYQSKTTKTENQRPELSIRLEMLRQDLVGELEAINQYQEHIDLITDEEIRHVLSHIRDDEKEHVAELTKILRKLDAVQEEKFHKEEL